MTTPASATPLTTRVLVVDDDPAILTMARAILESTGFEIIATKSGEEATQIYHQAHFAGESIDMVLLDITLPGGMTGIETLDELKRIDPGVRVVACSGYFDESAASAAKRRGFVGILPKPFSADRLAKIVQWGVSRAA